MRKLLPITVRPAARTRPARVVRLALEDLEGRLLLYSTLGAQWTYDSRISYSFMPDGTSVGGVPSSLFATMNAVAPTATWEAQFEQAASLWQTAANVNLALVPDGGEPVGVNGDQQDDPRFGDIRIGAVPLPAGVLAETFVPPPINGGTDAGDILFNSTVDWAINNTYDIMTVAAHEFGHALGLGDSTVSEAVMYGTYNGTKQALYSDDISGIDSIYGAQQYDQFNDDGSRNDSFFTATNLTSYINSESQIAIPGLDNTTPGDAEWYEVTVPSSTTGQMTITVQTANLSSFAPGLMVYNSTLSLVSENDSLSEAGDTVSVTLSVTSGQKYYFKVLAAGSGTVGTVGSYGLLLNFGSDSRSPIPPPDTVVPQQPNEGGGVTENAIEADGITGPDEIGLIGTLEGAVWTTIGDLSGYVAMMYAPATAAGGALDSERTFVAAAAWSSPAPSIAGDSIGALPGPSTTGATPSTPGIGPAGDADTGQDPGPAASTTSPAVDVVYQAVDAVIQGWTARHERHATDMLKKHQS
jgi:hypothetical protein